MAVDMMEETPRAQLRDVDPSTLWVAYGYAPPGEEPENRSGGGRPIAVSGELAAKAVIDPGPRAGLVERYRRSCDAEIGTELRDSVLLQRFLVSDRRRIGRIISDARSRGETTRRLLDYVVGAAPVARCAARSSAARRCSRRPSPGRG